jgi:hypothetical protein
MYTLIIAMSLLTSVIAPPVLSVLLGGKNLEPSPNNLQATRL